MIIRPAHTADAHAMAHIYVQTWQDTYLGVVPYDYLYTMSAARHTHAFSDELKNGHVISFVAEDTGKVIGFVTGGSEKKGDLIYSGEIYTLYVLKNHQRQGIGQKLVSALTDQLHRLGIYSMLVWVLEHNPYKRFYEKMNGIYLRTNRTPLADEMLEVVAYGWIDTSLIHR
jgi:ribosomal protein S18 acetylase RimI-like enzyme